MQPWSARVWLWAIHWVAYVPSYVTACDALVLYCLQWSVRARVSRVPTEHRSAPPRARSSHLRPPSPAPFTPRTPAAPPSHPAPLAFVARRPRPVVTCVAGRQSQSGRVVRHPLRTTRATLWQWRDGRQRVRCCSLFAGWPGLFYDAKNMSAGTSIRFSQARR